MKNLIVVFKKGIDPAAAEAFLKEEFNSFRPGMDNSRDQEYINQTGPKYIVPVSEAKKIKDIKITSDCIYEIYEANKDTNR